MKFENYKQKKSRCKVYHSKKKYLRKTFVNKLVHMFSVI